MAVVYMGMHPFTKEGLSWLVRSARRYGVRVIPTSGFRDLRKQAELLRSGRAITPAGPGRSTHNYGLAFDAVVPQGMHSPQQRLLGQLWESAGMWWGGRFGDPVHFQVIAPATWRAWVQQKFGTRMA